MTVASEIADYLQLKKLIWIPAGNPPHKQGNKITSAGLRLEMARSAASADSRFEVSTMEIDRPGPSYTLDTVQRFHANVPDSELFLILGADQVRALRTWQEPEQIVEIVRLAIMNRQGNSAMPAIPTFPGASNAVHVPVTRLDISSTQIRGMIQANDDPRGLVPDAVSQIIERERLYSSP